MTKRTISKSEKIECRSGEDNISCKIISDGSTHQEINADKVYVDNEPLTRKIENQGVLKLDTDHNDIEILESESYTEVNVLV